MGDKSSRQEIRKALSNWHDLDALRGSPLAEQVPRSYLLSAAGDRGLALQHLLDEAIKQLKLAETKQDTARAKRLYPALRYRYIERLSAQEVRDRLFISKSELYRTLDKAIAEIVDFWQRAKRRPQNVIGREPVPLLERFVGRQKELVYFRHCLTTQHFVIIRGMAGVGKTSLGAELVSDLDIEKVLWVRFSPGRNADLETLLESLALGLAARGLEAAWLFLRSERQKLQPPSRHLQARYLVGCLESAACTICLDDFHLVDGNPAIASFCADLLQSAQCGRLNLVIMSRTVPGFACAWAFPRLEGLGLTETYDLLNNEGLSFLAEHIKTMLYEKTAGMPIFLTLFAALVHSRGLDLPENEAQIAALVERIEREVRVQDYLLREVAATLSPDEELSLMYAAALRTAFDAEDDDLCTLLTSRGVDDVTSVTAGLARKHLATWQSDGTLAFHPLVATFFYRRLKGRPSERVQIHRGLAGYYEDRREWLEAAHHYFEVGEYERAARLLSGNVTWLINAGQAEAALAQLERLAFQLARVGGDELRFEVAAARETLCHLLGWREKQKPVLDSMLVLVEELDDDRRLAVLCNRWARFHDVTGDYPAAGRWARSGLEAARRAGDGQAEVESLNLWAWALWHRSEYAAARGRSEQALALAREVGDQLGEAASLDILCNTCFELGDYATARDYNEQILVVQRATGDWYGEATALNSLGAISSELGNYAAAMDYHQQVLTISQAIGAQRAAAVALNNLGVVYHYLGDYAAARGCCEESLAIKRTIGDRRGEVISLCNLGEVYTKLGDYVAAKAHEEQGLTLAREIGDRHQAGCALTYLGKALEGLEDPDGAEEAYREALAIRREIGQPARAIDDVAGLGRVALMRSEKQEAKRYAEECLAHVATHGVAGIEHVFEVYLACVHILETCGEEGQARAVQEKAYTLLMERADRIDDETLRRSFLENVPARRALWEAWEKG
ncbi:MAG: tetratricopeptide repeat protein [Chloroflexota bacterium]|nr:tetratricopeptide repeat protein [Chloroflexota bacterium]